MWKVTNEFKEVNHENHIYKKGDVYPADGYEANIVRVEFLQKPHNQYGVAFLGESLDGEVKEGVQAAEVTPEQVPEQVQEKPVEVQEQPAETQEQPEGLETEQEKPSTKAKRAPRTKKTSSKAKGDEE